MALVKGKFVDKDQLIQANSDPVDVKDLARKGYVDQKAADEADAAELAAKSYADTVSGNAQSAAQTYADAKVEDQIVNGVTEKAPSQNAVFDALALKQDSLGTGTTSQFLRGDLTWQEVATSVGIAQTKVVSKGGSDVTGDGTLSKPYATIAAAMASITDASPTKRYIIKVEAGAYTEGALTLKPNVFVVGDLKEAVRVTASSVALDATFSGASSVDNRSGMARIILTGACTFDWNAVTSAAGKLYFTEVSFSSAVTMNGYNNAIAQAQFDSCQLFGTLTVSGINVGVFKDNICYGNVTMNQHPNGGMATILSASGGYIGGTLTLTTTVDNFGRRCSAFLRGMYIENLVVDGVSSYADADLISQGKSAPQLLNGGQLVAMTPRVNHDLETKMLKPLANNAHNSGDWGKQWMFNFAYVHASAGTDMYILSAMENYDPAGDTAGKTIFIQPDAYGLQANANGGNIELETAAVSGTGVRGKVKINAKELDLTNHKIVNVANATDSADAVNKGQMDSALGGKQDSLGTGTAGQYLAGDLTWQDLPAAAVDDEIVDGVTDRAPSQNAVYDALSLKLDQASKGAANGIAELDGSGKVPSTQLPSYVDDIIEVSDLAALPVSGETGKIYVTLDTNKCYRWSGSTYIEVSPGPGSTDSVAEGTTNLYFTDARAKTAAVVDSTAGSQTDQAASVAAMKSFVAAEIAAIPAAQTPVGKKERFVLTATDISNGYVDCAFEAMADTMMVMTGGVVHNEGSGDDYVLSLVAGKTRISFEPDLAAILAEGDDIYIQYLRLA
jgi:hypothetical protein